jgi:DNA mismatch repair protein MutL
MAQKIVRLSEAVINKIAAGEVVENPASIVKELIENSLDAGARRIAATIQGGGQLLVEIEDDGCGMSPEDALLCLERHATSKIRSAEDLSALETMGFRGEALAAIAAVSHFELKTSDGEIGTRIRAEGGKIESIEPCARNRGTTITVRSLFYNVPARKKFQKSTAACAAQVAKTFEAIALAHPEVSFLLRSQNETLLQLEPEDQRKRIEAVLGVFAQEVQVGSMKGFLSAPQDAKPHRRNQFLYINRRPVFSPLISRAVQAGYGTRLAENAYPPFVLFLEIDPGEVDVNVHPQKKEVRLANESALFRQIESAVAESFSPPSFSSPLVFSQTPSFCLAEDPFPQSLPVVETPLPFEIEERALGVLDRFLLLEGFLLVDLAGAHARVLFEEMKESGGERQSLMWPIEIEVDDLEVGASLQSIRIDCRPIGQNRLAIDAIPPSLEPSRFGEFFSAWKEGKSLEEAAIRFCRAAKRKHSLEEAVHLWGRLKKCRDRMYDPIGRRIWTEIASSDLERILKQ